MRIARLTAPRTIELLTVESLTPGDFDAIVDVSFCGLCGTDIHEWNGGGARTVYPLNPGHEVSGVVAAVGLKVTKVKVGDRVTSHPYSYCGTCHFCRIGLINACEGRSFQRDGWAEQVKVHEAMLYPVPDGVSLEVASLAEPLGAALQAIDVAPVKSGSTVLIVGGGPIGLSVLALIRRSGAAKVILSEPSEMRRDLASKLGADVVVDPTVESLAEIVMRETQGYGVDAAFECVTRAATTAQAIELLRFGGEVVIVGNANPSDLLEVNLDTVHRRQISIRGTFSRASLFPRVMNWLPVLGLDALITDIIPLDKVEDALLLASSGGAGKVLLRP